MSALLIIHEVHLRNLRGRSASLHEEKSSNQVNQEASRDTRASDGVKESEEEE